MANAVRVVLMYGVFFAFC